MLYSSLKPRLVASAFCATALFMTFLVNTACNRVSNGEDSEVTTEIKPQQDHRRSDNPLADYVYTPDDSFSYEIVHEAQNSGYKYYVLRMVSQQWLSTEEVTDPVWWHWVSV